MDKKQVQDAIGCVDNALAQLAISRQSHVILVDNVKLIQQCCVAYFDHVVGEPIPEKKDGGTNIIPISPESDDKDSERSGDSV